ncbi:hypothetical protein KGF57_002820 [Candida theae]|uniref:PSP1 C-terminal domain-containing protein n=1 Tax=Candida theae TaxID=1198502 RepID=A0AAD5BE87_9ASCO|nr:uncharacterized protein KGF57_002820 [Candida theae]KAI5958012.1 hypothetical protein KGF57_002820 [Candida theae]
MMNLPDFLNNGDSINGRDYNSRSNGGSRHNSIFDNGTSNNSIPPTAPSNNDDPLHQSDFNDILYGKLSNLNDYTEVDYSRYYYNQPTANNSNFRDTFNLPAELQGGVTNISSRRPSYAAESFTRNNFFQQQPSAASPSAAAPAAPAAGVTPSQTSQFGSQSSNFFGNSNINSSHGNRGLSSFAMINNFQAKNNQFNGNGFNFADAFGELNLNSGSRFSEFQSRRPSQLVDFPWNSPAAVAPAPAPAAAPAAQPQSQPQLQSQQFFSPQQLQSRSFEQPGAAVAGAGRSVSIDVTGTNTFAPFADMNTAPTSGQARQQSRATIPPQVMPRGMAHGGKQQSSQTREFYPSSQQPQLQFRNAQLQPDQGFVSHQTSSSTSAAPGQSVKLENGLLLKDQYIVASPDLKQLYSKTKRYYQDEKFTSEVLTKINGLLGNPVITKLITFIKNLNNLTFNHKILCLVINKNGKFDLLSYPNNSNIFLQKEDLVIVDGDRGKDLVMIVEPLVNLNFAVLFNFFKKLEHLKSLTIHEGHGGKAHGGTHPTTMNASTIINSHSNEDNEFIITLPTKQVLRFATPKEVHKISGKFLEEKKAFITCFNKIKELGLDSDLTLINVEYQCDFKKLIFYYFAGFKRIDFRGLIKELFKIYKTRIWLCAVLPFNQPELYITMEEEEGEKRTLNGKSKTNTNGSGDFTDHRLALFPKEYELTNEQILNFAITEFDSLPPPNYFHSVNLLNLIRHLTNELKSPFYGFNNDKSESK